MKSRRASELKDASHVHSEPKVIFSKNFEYVLFDEIKIWNINHMDDTKNKTSKIPRNVQTQTRYLFDK